MGTEQITPICAFNGLSRSLWDRIRCAMRHILGRTAQPLRGSIAACGDVVVYVRLGIVSLLMWDEVAGAVRFESLVASPLAGQSSFDGGAAGSPDGSQFVVVRWIPDCVWGHPLFWTGLLIYAPWGQASREPICVPWPFPHLLPGSAVWSSRGVHILALESTEQGYLPKAIATYDAGGDCYGHEMLGWSDLHAVLDPMTLSLHLIADRLALANEEEPSLVFVDNRQPVGLWARSHGDAIGPSARGGAVRLCRDGASQWRVLRLGEKGSQEEVRRWSGNRRLRPHGVALAGNGMLVVLDADGTAWILPPHDTRLRRVAMTHGDAVLNAVVCDMPGLSVR